VRQQNRTLNGGEGRAGEEDEKPFFSPPSLFRGW